MEALIVGLLVLLLMAAGGAALFLGLSRLRPTNDPTQTAVLLALQPISQKLDTLDELKTKMEVGDRKLDEAQKGLETLKTKMEVGDEKQSMISRTLEEAQKGLETLKTQAEERRRAQDEMVKTIRRIESVFYGSASRGRAGENVLGDALRSLPQGMVVTDLRIRGKVVEFALVLADGRYLPIDSKWPAVDLLSGLENIQDDDRQALVGKIQKAVEGRIREVEQYIDPERTTPYALAAFPDAVLAVCTTVYFDAHRRRVLLMTYSMAVPYLLALYRLHMQYSQSIDLENLKTRLADIGRGLDQLEELLENRAERGATMIQNFSIEAHRVLSRLRGSLTTLQSIAPGTEPAMIGPVDPEVSAGQSDT